jgi:ABC-type multidrug transport system fused ATPase/permease subunit
LVVIDKISVNTFLEFTSDLISSFRERLKNSFLSSFIIGFLIANWESLLVILFSDKIIEERIRLVHAEYTSKYTLVWYPLIFAIFYVVILPYLMLGIEWLSNMGLEKRKDNKNESTIKHLERLRKRATTEFKLAQERSGLREQSELNSTIEDLTTRLEITLRELESVREERNSEQKKRVELEEATQKVKTKSTNISPPATTKPPNLSSYSKYEVHLSESQEQAFDEAFDNFCKDKKLYEGLALLVELSEGSRNIFDSFSKDLIDQYVHWGVIKVELDQYAEFTAKGKYFWNKYISIQESGDV